MTAPQLTKTWNITANQRRAYTSLVDMAGWWAYTNKTALLAAGWTVVWTCDGTTGPTNSADHTDRITDATKFATRATIAGAAQSFFVLQNADGVQLLFTYQGASDDIFRISWSPTTAFTLAGTTTQQPTATDENLLISATSLVNATTSLDRVGSIWCTSDARSWSCALFRSSALIGVLGLEKVSSLCAAGVFDIPYVGYRYISFDRVSTNIGQPTGGRSAIAIGGASYEGAHASVVTSAVRRTTRVGGGDITLIVTSNNNAIGYAFWNADKPALQGGLGSPLLPIYWSGEKAANLDGMLGVPIDTWQMYTASGAVPAIADFVPGFEPGDVPGVSGGQTGVGDARTNWLVAFGSMWVRPWKNAAATMERT